MDDIREAAQALANYLTQTRRELHMHPELGEHEYDTSAYICKRLDEMGIEYFRYPDYTAVVGLIRGTKPSDKPVKTVALRADIDALPVTEHPGREYGSQNPGCMHACGHDAHTTILLGAAKLLQGMRDRFSGNVKLLFQPAEETVGGADKMIKLGCMENPHVDYALGLHVMPRFEYGYVETRYGALNGSTDDLYLTVRGKSGHGAYPENGVDAIVIAANVITALQTLVSRHISPLNSAVITIGKIEGGTATNIICGEVNMMGTLRTLDRETRADLKQQIRQIVENVSRAYGGEGEVDIHDGYCALVNHTDAVYRSLKIFKAAVGDDHVLIKAEPSMGGEDFSYFINDTPGMFYHLGCANADKGITAPLHTADFDIDERCLPLGVELQSKLVLDYLAE